MDIREDSLSRFVRGCGSAGERYAWSGRPARRVRLCVLFIIILSAMAQMKKSLNSPDAQLVYFFSVKIASLANVHLGDLTISRKFTDFLLRHVWPRSAQLGEPCFIFTVAIETCRRTILRIGSVRARVGRRPVRASRNWGDDTDGRKCERS